MATITSKTQMRTTSPLVRGPRAYWRLFLRLRTALVKPARLLVSVAREPVTR
jgi:hypothetical protein